MVKLTESLKALRLSSGVQLSMIYLTAYFWSCYATRLIPDGLSLLLITLLGIAQTSWCMLLDDAFTFYQDIHSFSTSHVQRYKPSLKGEYSKDDLYWMSIGGLILCLFIVLALFQSNLVLWGLVEIALTGGLFYIRWNKMSIAAELALSYPIGLIMFTISYAIASNLFFALLFLGWGWLAYIAVIAHADIAELPLKTNEKNMARFLGATYYRETGYRIIPNKLRLFIVSCYTLALICELAVPCLLGLKFLPLIIPFLTAFLVLTLKTTNWSLNKLKFYRVVYNYLATFTISLPLFFIYPIQFGLTYSLLIVFLLGYNYLCFKGPLHTN